MQFSELGLNPAVLQALVDAGYTQPTPVQEQAIPAALAGHDLIVSSQTGSGKTAAFMLPSIHRFAEAPRLKAKTFNQERQAQKARGERPRYQPAQPRMLVLAPTRELAAQVSAATDQYGTHVRRLRVVSILGGMPYPKQLQLLAKNPEILVATPGRLIDHLNSGKIDFSELEILVLDEADRMLDMGFIEDIETIVAATPTERQTMLFSATLEGQVGKLAENLTREPMMIRIAGATTRHENIEQRIHFVDDQAHKNRLLDHLLRDAELHQALIFTATKRDADLIADQLLCAGFSAAALHGDMQQRARNRTISDMRNGRIRILVATDVAARGLDVPGITHVFNYDLPKFAEDYVHRIGRTGRAGRSGLAVSLVHHGDGIHVKRIERFTRQEIPVDIVPGFEPQKSVPERKKKPQGWKPGQGKKSYGQKPEWQNDRPRREGFESGRARQGEKPAFARAGKQVAKVYQGKPSASDYPSKPATTTTGYQGKPAPADHQGKPAFSKEGRTAFAHQGNPAFSREGRPGGFSRGSQVTRQADAGDRPFRKPGGLAKPAANGRRFERG